MKKHLLTLLGVIAVMTLGSCAKEYNVDRGDINAAVALSANDLTASAAVIKGVSAQDNLATCIYVKPTKAGDFDFLNMDAIKRKAYILEHGTEVAFPLEQTESGLLPGTSYIVAVMGKDADGVFRTAPYSLTFTTKVAEAVASIAPVTGTTDKFAYSVTLGEYAKSCRYIVSTDASITAKNSEQLLEYLKSNGAGVQTSTTNVSGEITLTSKADIVVAALAYDDANRPAAAVSSDMVSSETLVKVGNVKLAAPKAGVELFEGTVKMSATSEFAITINGIDYGFISYSGNGGVGTVNNMYSAMPFYSMKETMTYKFTVSKAIGQMAIVSEGANKFWTNMDADADVFVRVDLTNPDGIYRYYFEIPEKDASVVFYEGFDLSTWGGFYQAPVAGTGGPNGTTAEAMAAYDGTEPGVKGSVNTTSNALDSFTYPESAPHSETGWKGVISATLMKNWGLDEWTFAGRGNLSAGHTRIQSSSANNLCYAVTPKFKKLSGPTKVTVTIHAFCFAAELAGDFEIAVLGAGKITNVACTNTKGYSGVGGTFTDTVFTPEAALLPKETNSVVNKSIATMVLTVEGATADTQLRFGKDVALAAGNNGRICIDDIKVTK